MYKPLILSSYIHILIVGVQRTNLVIEQNPRQIQGDFVPLTPYQGLAPEPPWGIAPRPPYRRATARHGLLPQLTPPPL